MSTVRPADIKRSPVLSSLAIQNKIPMSRCNEAWERVSSQRGKVRKIINVHLGSLFLHHHFLVNALVHLGSRASLPVWLAFHLAAFPNKESPLASSFLFLFFIFNGTRRYSHSAGEKHGDKLLCIFWCLLIIWCLPCALLHSTLFYRFYPKIY